MNSALPSTRRRKLILSGIAAALLPKFSLAAPQGYGIVGERAPELDVPYWIDGQGNSSGFSLAAHRGKFVMLECWQSWCPGCHSHGFPALQKIHTEFKDSEFFVAAGIQTTFEGYSTNTVDKLRVMQQRYDLPITMGHDEGDSATHKRPNTMRSYRTGGTPWAILISPDGYVIYNDFSIDADNTIDYLHTEIDKVRA